MPLDIKDRYRTADFVGRDRVVFNIGGNKYRLIVAIDYARHIVLIKFIGTHEDYDNVDAATIGLPR
jgi:mRNA interferase HigB